MTVLNRLDYKRMKTIDKKNWILIFATFTPVRHHQGSPHISRPDVRGSRYCPAFV